MVDNWYHGDQKSSASLQYRKNRRLLERFLLVLVILLIFFNPYTKYTRKFSNSAEKRSQHVLSGCAGLEADANQRREFIDISFEEATQDDKLVGWEEDWVAFGKLPYIEAGTNLGRTKFDSVISWVNGSEANFAEIRKVHAKASHLNRPDNTWLHDSLSRHREWSQIQWAVLACIRNIESLNHVQLLTSHHQIPEYPDLNEAELAQIGQTVQHINDATLFDPEVRKCALPTFNSVSIEVNMGKIPSEVDKFMYICDDMLLTTQYRDGDIYTPLFGLSMVIYDALVWNAKEDDQYSVEQPNRGEYPEYHHSSVLFNRAFGIRNRAYVRHATKVYSRKLLREVAAAFPAAYADASLSKFRGDRQIINPHFHAHHYVIERHRKALLWSFLQLKSDANADGVYNWDERRALKKTLDAIRNEDYVGVTRKTLKLMSKDLYLAGYSAAHALRPRWSSFDGPSYAFFNETPIEQNPIFHEYKTAVPDKPHLEYRCEIDYKTCFGADFFTSRKNNVPVDEILDRFSRVMPQCGDCLINKLVLASGEKGLNAFLPTTEFPESRDLAVKAIMRYTYTKNKLPGNMVILGPSDYDLDLLKYKLDILTEGHEPMPSQMCINDDVPMDTPLQRVGEIKQHLSHFYRNILEGKVLDPSRVYETPVMPNKSDYTS